MTAAGEGIVALDLFAGTGWGVACQRLGIEEYGVELMPEAVASREANGMRTLYHDVWEGLDGDHDVPDYELLIASPPCQTFSMAGSGKGRAALDEVIGLIRSRLFLHPHELRAFGERHDPRTALVLTPLAHVARDTPRLVVFEQVPTVLPVWEACAEVMREWGYSVWTGNLQAEMFGVPQTRKRAILIARWDGEAKPPTPTHSRYYSRNPEKLDEGVLPWVSMAEALGWGRTARPSVTVTGGGTHANGDVSGHTGGAEPLAHLAREVAAPDWVMRSNYGTGGDASKRGERSEAEPAPTVTSKVDRNLWLTANDRLSNAARRHVNTPAPTITGGHDSGNRKWVEERPATTVAGDPRIAQPGWRGGRRDYEQGKAIENQHDNSVRVTIEEAATLQSYPEGFVFAGNKGKQFLQVGNAVPPKLAEAILASLLT